MTASWRILEGDCRDVLRTLPERSVHTVVTSPPYFGLRDYGTGEWEGGDAGCDHLGAPHRTQAGFNERYFGRETTKEWTDKQGELRQPFKGVCGKCGARRVDRQIGLEPTPDEFVAALVAVFREVRRVLRDDGTVWLNLGDSYAAQGGSKDANTYEGKRVAAADWQPARRPAAGLKPKDLIGIPWMVAFALRADGWYLRSEIIWAKPNPMPESVTDRPTRAHEQIFLLSKQPRYYYDADAIREPVAPSQVGRVRADPIGGKSWQGRQQHSAGSVYRTGPSRSVVDVDADNLRTPSDSGKGAAGEFPVDEVADGFEASLGVVGIGAADLHGDDDVGGVAGEGFAAHGNNLPSPASNASGRNKRSVWTVATQPLALAHFATFPPKLIEPCILAGCPERACGECGAPWVRVVEAHAGGTGIECPKDADGWAARPSAGALATSRLHGQYHNVQRQTTGFESSCSHGDGSAAGVVLDPFAGAGTTGMVALRHNRSFIGIELSPAYAEMARERIRSDSPLLNTFAEAA